MVFQGPPPQEERQFDGVNYAHYLKWHAQGSADNQILPATFSIRASGADNLPQPCQAITTGVVWDIENIETGWQSWPNGGPKDYRPNPTPSTPLPYPGAGFSECVKIPIAVDLNTVACWDQASTGTWKGFCQIAAVIAQQAPQNPGLYPLIRFTGATLTSTGRNSTQVPNFDIIQWVQQPPCFAPQAQQPMAPPAGGFAQPAPPQAPPQAPIQAPAAPTQQQLPGAAPVAPPAGAWNT